MEAIAYDAVEFQPPKGSRRRYAWTSVPSPYQSTAARELHVCFTAMEGPDGTWLSVDLGFNDTRAGARIWAEHLADGRPASSKPRPDID